MSNILFAAISTSLKKYFEIKSMEIPKNMTIVVPSRMNQPQVKLKLENEYSVGMQDVPINIEDYRRKIELIKSYSDSSKLYPEYFTNYWSLKLISTLLPEHILKKILISQHATLTFSNLPGPTSPIKIDDFTLEKFCFLLPNVDLTACGMTLLTYQNKISLGIMADESAISCEEDLNLILKGFVKAIEEMKDQFLC
jgi:hypothetical protein